MVFTSFKSENIPEQRNHDCRKRNHHSGKKNGKYHVFSFVMVNLKTISCNRTYYQSNQGKDHRISKRIPHSRSQRLICNQIFKIFHQMSSGIQSSCNYIRTLIRCSTCHVIQWKYRQESRQWSGMHTLKISLAYSSSLITHFHLDYCQDCNHDQNQNRHSSRIPKLRTILKRSRINIM